MLGPARLLTCARCCSTFQVRSGGAPGQVKTLSADGRLSSGWEQDKGLGSATFRARTPTQTSVALPHHQRSRKCDSATPLSTPGNGSVFNSIWIKAQSSQETLANNICNCLRVGHWVSATGSGHSSPALKNPFQRPLLFPQSPNGAQLCDPLSTFGQEVF